MRKKLREARERRKWSLRDMGELTGIHWTTIGRWERGVRTPTLAQLMPVAAAFRVLPSTVVRWVTE